MQAKPHGADRLEPSGSDPIHPHIVISLQLLWTAMDSQFPGTDANWFERSLLTFQ